MSLFMKKPVVIEAVQWFNHGDHASVVLKSAPNRYADEGIPWIETLEGGHIVKPGDWIITGVKGEHYPCKPDIFCMTYEPVGQPQTDPDVTAQAACPVTASPCQTPATCAPFGGCYVDPKPCAGCDEADKSIAALTAERDALLASQSPPAP